jgi:hypothetical protein
MLQFIAGLDDIGASADDIVTITSSSFIMESSPAQILVVDWVIFEKSEQ